MKKQILCGMFVMVGTLLTSCIGDTNKITYNRLGVVETSPTKRIYTSDGFMIASSFLDALDAKAGDCCIIDFKTDFSGKSDNGVYEADILSYEPLKTWEIASTLTDTAVILPGEVFVTPAFNKSIYLRGRYFLQASHPYPRQNEVEKMDLSYNVNQEFAEDTVRVYNLFLRVTKEGGTDTLATSIIQTDAYIIERFVEEVGAIEKEQGNQDLNFKIYYAQRYNADTTACIFTATGMFTIPLAGNE